MAVFLPYNGTFVQEKGNIDIWLIETSQYNEDTFSSINLDNSENKRYQQFYFDRHRVLFKKVKQAQRYILSHYLNCKSDAIVFDSSQHGKPYVINPQSNLCFNLSHSKTTALLALGINQSIGIDIEYHSDRRILDLADRFFSPKEVKAIQSLENETEKVELFFHIWALKEAFIKAIGLGLKYPLDSFTVPISKDAHRFLLKDNQGKAWYLSAFKKEQAAMGLCTDFSRPKLNFYDFNKTFLK